MSRVIPSHNIPATDLDQFFEPIETALAKLREHSDLKNLELQNQISALAASIGTLATDVQTRLRLHNVQISDLQEWKEASQSVDPPAASIWWDITSPDSHELGSDDVIPFHVAEPNNGDHVLVLAQTQAQVVDDAAVIAEFTVSMSVADALVVPADKLNILPQGTIRLQLLLRNSANAVLGKVYHWIEVVDEVIEVPPVIDPPPIADPPGDRSGFLATNLQEVNYWTHAWVFKNLGLMIDKSSGDTSHEGYVFVNADGRYPGGKYKLANAPIDLELGSDARDLGGGWIQVDPTDAGISVKSGDPLGISLIHETLINHPNAFHPKFLADLALYKCIRFMDWLRTNTSGNSPLWSTRTTLTGRQTDGVAIEHMIDLCNILQADPWFCMPHAASRSYIRNFAELVKSRLDPGLKIYVEWSNEVWNSQFDVNRWVAARSDNYGSDAFFNLWANKCKTTFDVWNNVFGDDKSRLVRVLACQLQSVWVAKKMTQRMVGQYDALAPSAYFGITRRQRETLNSSTTAQTIIDLCRNNIVNDNRRWYAQHRELVDEYNVLLPTSTTPIKLVGYEGGQHLTAGGNRALSYKAALLDAQTHPRMYELYQNNMNEFRAAGGSLFVHFNNVSKSGIHGSWGLVQYQDATVDVSPKLKAVLDYEHALLIS